MSAFIRTIAARCRGALRHLAAFRIAVLIPATVALAGCPPMSTNWKQSAFANKRVLILEEDVRMPCEGFFGGVTIKGDPDSKFILKFRDGQNRQVFVGQAAACFEMDGFCQFAATSLIVPEGESSSPWTGQITGILERTCTGDISPVSDLRGPDGAPYKCDGKLSAQGTCYGKKIFLHDIPPKHRVEVVE